MNYLKMNKNRNRVSVIPPKEDKVNISLIDVETSAWVRKANAAGTDGTVRRRRRSFEAGTEEYAEYIQKRVFNKRHAWRPYLRERKRDKNKLGNLNPTQGWKGWKHRQRMRWTSLKYNWRELTGDLELWKGSLKEIEGRQGVGVVSYFNFLKWLLNLNIFIFLVMFFVVVLFQVAFDNAEFDKAVTGVDDSASFPGVILSDNCSAIYQPNVTHDALNNILDFAVGTGWMETTAFFYGYYTNTRLNIPTGKYNMPLAYLCTVCVVFFVSLIVMVHHALSKFFDTLLITEERRRKAKFFYGVISRWDYRISDKNAVVLQHKSFYDMFIGELEEQRHQKKLDNSSRLRLCLLWTIRVLMNILVIGLLVGAGTAIFFAQKFSLEFTSNLDAKSFHPIVVALVQFLPSIIIAIFNGISPVVFQSIIKFEDYMPSTVIQLTTIRIVFLRLASLAVMITKVYIDVTCSPEDSCRVGIEKCNAVQCWESYVGQQIYKLVVVEIVSDVLLTILYELPRKLLTTKLEVPLFKKIGPAEFDIPINVLDLVYAQTLCWLGIYFAPLLSAVCVLRLVLLFYLRKLSAMFNTVPPDRPYHAARSNVFFMFTLMIAYILVTIPIGYVLVKMPPSPMCGPFRIYEAPTDILVIKIKTADYWFQTVWGVVTSSAFVALIIIVMSLALYYCHALKGRQSHLIAMMKLQILQDEKDKQHLISKLGEYTREPDSKLNHKTEMDKMSEVNVVHQVEEINAIHRVPEKRQPPPGVLVEETMTTIKYRPSSNFSRIGLQVSELHVPER